MVIVYDIIILFINSNYSQVGTSCKGNQNFKMKPEKKEVKQHKTNDTNAVLSTCKGVGHSSSQFPLCKKYLLSKIEVFNNNLGKPHQSFTRKIPFKSCIRNNETNIATTSSSANSQSTATIKSRIIRTCEDVRQLMFRAQVFVNYYILVHKDVIIPNFIFRQNFWYSICQLVNNCKVTNGTTLPSDIIFARNVFRTKYPSIIYKVELASGNSQCILEACTTVVTSYLKNMVELSKVKTLRYIRYILHNTFMISIKY